MRNFVGILLLVLMLNGVYCSKLTTEVNVLSSTKTCHAQSESTKETTSGLCLASEEDKNDESASKSSFSSSEVSTTVSTAAVGQSRTTFIFKNTESTLNTPFRTSTTELQHQTKKLTTYHMFKTIGSEQTSTEASVEEEPRSFISVPNNTSAGDESVPNDNVNLASSTNSPERETNMKSTVQFDESVVRSKSTESTLKELTSKSSCKESTSTISTPRELTSTLHPKENTTTISSKEMTTTLPHPKELTTTLPLNDFNSGHSNEQPSQPKGDLVSLLLNVHAPVCYQSTCKRSADSKFNCYCDELCYFYNDCCYSMIEKLIQGNNTRISQLTSSIQEKVLEVENKTLMLRKDLTACVANSYNKSGFVMVSKCDQEIKTSEDISKKCELSPEWYSYKNVPADHVKGDKVLATFKNIYCAICNGIPQNETIFWNINISCRSGSEEKIAQMKLEDIAQIEECILRPYSKFSYGLRNCVKEGELLEACDETNHVEIKELCSSYLYPLAADSNKVGPVYRNPHCANCAMDKMSVRTLSCVVLNTDKTGDYDPSFITGPVNLQVIFDFSFDRVIVSEIKCVPDVTCKIYEIYDCASKRCRQLYCQEGEHPIEGVCVETPGTGSGYALVDTFKPVDGFNNSTNEGEMFVIEVISDDDADMVLFALQTSAERILQIIRENMERFVKILKFDIMGRCSCLKIHISEDESNFIISDLFPELIVAFKELEERERRGYSLIPMFIKVRNFQEMVLLDCPNGKLVIETNPSIVATNTTTNKINDSSLVFLLPSSGIMAYEENSVWEIGYTKKTGVIPNVVATCHDKRPSLNCSMVAYMLNEVVLTNTSVKIINTSLTFEEGEFKIFQNKVFICADEITKTDGFVNVFKFSVHHRILSFVTSLVSALSAAVVVMIHICSKRVRNIHGLNLSALSVSTMILHFLLILQPSLVNNTTCLVYSIALHFIVLNIFIWMNIIGYDMARIFMSKHIVSQSTPFKRFLGYLFISLVPSGLIVVVSVSLDFTESAFKPNYGDENVCWLSNSKGIILFVICPVVLSLLLNFSFFTFTVKAIYSKAKHAKFARNRSYFVVYLKLTLILGLTWILGITGAFVEQEWLWIAHIVLNGMQGFSLMICSVVNIRNITRLRASLKLATANKAKSDGTESSNF